MSFRCSLWVLIWIVLSWLPVCSQTAVPPLLPPTATYTILTRDAILARLKQFSGTDHDRELRIKDWVAQAGCAAEHIAEQRISSGVAPNVICTLPGETDSVILVSGHFDYVKRGEGVVDNWSGASLLPSFVSTLGQSPRHHAFVLVAFTAEEKGLFGSEFYAKHLAPEQRERIAAVINLDTLGLGPTEVWVSHADQDLVRALEVVAHALNLPLRGANVEQVGSTDSESFARYKIPRITIHSVTQDTLRILHSPQDQLSAIRLDDYYATYRLLTAYLVYLDGYLQPKPESAKPLAPSTRPRQPSAAPSN